MPLEMTHQLDGYEFGTREHPVVILTGGYDPGATDSRTQDVENPVGDGNLFGQDWLTAPEMAFSMAVVRDTAEQAHPLTGSTPVAPGDTLRIGERYF